MSQGVNPLGDAAHDGPQGDAAPPPRRPLPTQVAEQVRDMILEGVLTPGARIPEQAVSERLAVSRTPLREALKILATEGLVELKPNRGAVVANPRPEEIRDLIQVMAALEALAGELACERASDTQIAEIRALHEELVAARARGDRLTYFKRNQDVHLAIVAAAGNAPLTELHRTLNARCYRILYMSNERNERWHVAVEDHQAMVDLLSARDAPALSALLRQHRNVAWEAVQDRLV
ncbi:MAG: GntR family transcriptional regulator [Chromatiales bacterium]|nr:GntR family transcriptional regulator [Chromatiales bacterium]